MVKISGLDKLLKDIDNKSKEAFKKHSDQVLLKITEDLKNNTPIDTGEARRGWEIEGENIVNRVEHIAELNEGSSSQAPAYFIERTVLSHSEVKTNGLIVKKLAPFQ
jgi:hypothetical protein